MNFRNFASSALSIAVCIVSLAANAQRLDSTINRYADRFQTEKAYLHYDKSSYLAGETIWFKAYVLEELLPATSKTLYVDWISETGDVLYHSVSPMVSGATNGSYTIPDDFNGNYIKVKAYTRWMLNFDTAFLYTKDIRVISKTAPKGTVKQLPPRLSLFPEGGDLVTGVPNRVAFKATDGQGRPLTLRGQLLDDKGTVLDTLKTLHDGMGILNLIPAEGASYLVRWRDGKGGEFNVPLPAPKTGTVGLQVAPAGTKRYVSVYSPAEIPENLGQLHLVGTMNQRVAFRTDITPQAGSAVRKIIPTEALPSGILTITLFDAAWNAVAERVTFVRNNDYSFKPSLEVKHWGLSKRARNELAITVPEKLSGTNLSISVTDASIDYDSTSTIISNLLLTADVRGYVFNPAYYFSNNSDSVAQHLDLVMLTNGWRRFKWEDVLQGKMPKISYPKDTSYLTLSGKVFGPSKAQLSGNETVILMIGQKDSGTRMLISPIERDGSFSEPDIIFFDTLRVFYQLKGSSFYGAEARFMTERLPAPNYQTASKTFSFHAPNDTTGNYWHSQLAAEALRLQQIAQGKLMQSVTVRAKAKTPIQVMEEKYASGFFRGGDGYQYDVVNDISALGKQNVFQYLQSRVPGLQITGVTAGSPPRLTWRGNTPALFLDELPVDPDMLNSISMTDIAYVKVLRPPFFGAAGGGPGGAIAVYTRKGDDLQSRPGGLRGNTILGYTPIREFYSPNYASFDRSHEQKDIRTTLYWNPMLLTTEKNRTALVTFYNNDVTKAFRVVIEGMSAEGILTHHEEILE